MLHATKAQRFVRGSRPARTAAILIVITLFAPLFLNASFFATAPSGHGPAASARIDLDRLPLVFVANHGQAATGVRFEALTPHMLVSLLADGLQLRFAPSGADQGVHPVELHFAGSQRTPQITGAQLLPGVLTMIHGNDPAHWFHALPTFAQVIYQGVYPGVDVVFYGTRRQFEYDLILAPRADPSRIALTTNGTAVPAVDADGSLLLTTPAGVLAQPQPIIYQQSGDGRRPITGRYTMRTDGTVGFALDRYDPTVAVVIDPVMTYGSFLGGSSDDNARGIARDAQGNLYIAGDSNSDDFPISPNAYQTQIASGSISAGGFSDLTVTKLDPTGTTMLYSTFIGGQGIDVATHIAVDTAGNALVSGYTPSPNASPDFPTTPNAVRRTKAGFDDGLLVKLNAQGSDLLYSTYFGGTDPGDGSGNVNNHVNDVAVDPHGNFYVTGMTDAADLPVTTGAFQTSHTGTADDAFVAKFGPDGTVGYSTYLGGSGYDVGNGLTVDPTGSVYVTGVTRSADFPVLHAAQSQPAGTLDDVFVTRLNAAGSGLIFSTFLGGQGNDDGSDVAIDPAGNAVVTGFTRSPDFPVLRAAQSTFGCCNSNLIDPADAFLTTYTAQGGMLYSTYLGGSNADTGIAVAEDGAGKAFVTGSTFSNFPVKNALQPNPAGSYEAFVAAVDTTQAGPASLLYASYLGGSDIDTPADLIIDATDKVYIVGTTASADFPTTNGFQPSFNGGSNDGFMATFDLGIGQVQGVGPKVRLPLVRR